MGRFPVDTDTAVVVVVEGDEPSSHQHHHGFVVVEECNPPQDGRPSNEYVLNVAFVSFLGFTIFQFFFATIAHSASMMTDCAAMMVDVVTYLFNFLAERLKHNNTVTSTSIKHIRLRRLYLELLPPLISVTTLIVVTISALNDAYDTLEETTHQYYYTDGNVSNDSTESKQPDLEIMLVFSGLNLVLDIVNVSCFARVDQAVGLPGQHTYQPHSHYQHNDTSRRRYSDSNNGMPQQQITTTTESTPLLDTNADDINNNTTARQPENDDDDDDLVSEESSQDATGVLNLNMCSAWTHVCADTLRSVAVLVAAGIAKIYPMYLSPQQADSYAAILVSIIILVSLLPLIQALSLTAYKIYLVWTGQDDDTDDDTDDDVDSALQHQQQHDDERDIVR